MKKLMISIFAIILLFILNCSANIRLPRLVGDNMVLQRDAPLKIWGWADPSEEITINFNGKAYATKANEQGNWLCKIDMQKAGGPFTMELKGKNLITLKNILVGDVWVCGGQSNMEWQFGFMPEKYKEELSNSANSNIRVLTVEKSRSFIPLDDIQTTGWDEAGSMSLRKFSAVAYFFGRDIYNAIKVPIGLISCNWGGTVAEAWTSAEGLKDFPSFLSSIDMNKNNESTANEIQQAWIKNQKDQIQKSLSDTSLASFVMNSENFKSMHLPSTWNTDDLSKFDGVVWFTNEIDIPSEFIGKDVVLHMPAIDDMDHTYVNGQKIGFTDGYNIIRKYTIPSNLLKAGKNDFKIRITDYWLGGGMPGVDDEFYLEAMGKKLNLSGIWKYQITNTFNIPTRPESGNSPNIPTVLYNGMLNPIINFSIKGAIWYQGESNASRAIEYRTLFPAMIKDWRAKWGQELPFFFVQLANFQTNDEWPLLREAQAMTLSLPKTGMAVAIDIGEPGDIHPRNKLDVGKRLALSALAIAYGQKITYSGPTFESAKIQENKIIVSFGNEGQGLMMKGKTLNGFELAGDDLKYKPAIATIEGNKVVVNNPEIKNPRFVRYAWASCPVNANLYNKEDLPAVPFRNDKQ